MRSRLGLGPLLISGMTALSGCGPIGGPSNGQGPLPHAVTALVVQKTSSFPGNHIPTWTVHAVDRSAVEALLGEMGHLPPPLPGAVHCPADLGVSLHLTFKDKARTILRASA